MFRGLLQVLCATALPGGMLAAVRADDHPAAVSATIADAKKYCEDSGGKFSIASSAVHKVELNGDKRDDYIVDFTGATCDGADGGVCGTGGCEISIMVALSTGNSSPCSKPPCCRGRSFPRRTQFDFSCTAAIVGSTAEARTA
jgi:hypothetical protein